jgi:glycine betaine/proline transport system substrate-binding protein
MRRTRRLRFGLAAGVALTLIAAGCGSDSKSSSDTTSAGSSGGSEEVRLAVNPWTGSAVNANIAKAVI